MTDFQTLRRTQNARAERSCAGLVVVPIGVLGAICRLARRLLHARSIPSLGYNRRPTDFCKPRLPLQSCRV